MTWAKNFWDIAHYLYWAPERLGLNPIPISEIAQEDGFISIPQKYTKSGRFRYRRAKWPEIFAELSRDEKVLNCFFDTMFSICPDYLIERWLAKPLGVQDSSEFRSFSLLDISLRYGWEDKNVMQQDGFFVSTNSIICVELKLGAPTSLEQFLKYVALAVVEERLGGRRQHVGLLYVVPRARLGKICAHIATWHSLTWSALQVKPGLKLNEHVKRIIEEDSVHFDDILRRVRLNAISWTDLYNGIIIEKLNLDSRDPAQQTLYRLLDGFAEQLLVHVGTGIGPEVSAL